MRIEINEKRNIPIIILRVFLGMCFITTGLNVFLEPQTFSFIPELPLIEANSDSMTFLHFQKVIESIFGLLIIFNFFVPLLLIVLSPLIFNYLYHSFFINVLSLPISFFMLACTLYLIYNYRKIYSSFLRPQIYSGSCDKISHLVSLDEVEEKIPAKAGTLKEIISQLEN